jgi:thiamine pyrophosphate-dependent acetolactate synthase large subunit-like protein
LADVDLIADALIKAAHPVVVTGYLGRNPKAVPLFAKLVELLGLPVSLAVPSAVNLPPAHPHVIDLNYGHGVNEAVRVADVVLIIDSDIPFVPLHNKPVQDAQIFHLDVDSIKRGISIQALEADLYADIDAETVLGQLLDACERRSVKSADFDARRNEVLAKARARQELITQSAIDRVDDGSITVHNALSILKRIVPARTLYMNEVHSSARVACRALLIAAQSISNYGHCWTVSLKLF